MEILLLEDVNGIGKKNDLLIVGDGYALNCLLPQRKALVATPTVRKRYADQIRKRAEEKEHDKQLQQKAAAQLAGKTVQFIRKTAKGGKLYAGITEKDIAQAMRDQLAANVHHDAIQLAEHIKTIGTFSVHVKVGDGVVSVPVIVSEEKPAKAKKEEKKEEAAAAA